MISLACLIRMLWQYATRERRKSSQQERAAFEEQKRLLEDDRGDIEHRLRSIESEASRHSVFDEVCSWKSQHSK